MGNPGTAAVQLAQAVARSLPDQIVTTLDSPGRALGALLALTLDPKPEMRQRQLELVGARLGEGVIAHVAALDSAVRALHPLQRLPLLGEVVPALRKEPREERRRILDCLGRLILIDGRIEIFEYCLAALARTYLYDELEPTARAGSLRLDKVGVELQTVFSTLAQQGASDEIQARRAYELGMHHLLPGHRPAYQPLAGWPRALDGALKCLDRLVPAAKEQLIEALVKTISHDGRVTVNEAELLRTICATLHCPLPPLLRT